MSDLKLNSIAKLRNVITLGALVLALAHILWPDLAVDAITLSLIAIAILPWLSPLIKSLETPNGWKVEFQDLENASARAEEAGLLSTEEASSDEEFSFLYAAKRDPNLGLVGLRIEIENRLMKLGRAYGLLQNNRPMGIGGLLRALSKHNVLSNEERSILSDMIHLLNGAAHGAEIEYESADWAIDVGPRLLTSLDNRIKEAPIPEEDIELLKKIKGSDTHPYYTTRTSSIDRLLSAGALTHGESSEGWFVRLTKRGEELARNSPNQ